jgi:hypothetical protein
MGSPGLAKLCDTLPGCASSCVALSDQGKTCLLPFLLPPNPYLGRVPTRVPMQVVQVSSATTASGHQVCA